MGNWYSGGKLMLFSRLPLHAAVALVALTRCAIGQSADAPRPQIDVPMTILAEPQSEVSIELKVGPTAALPRNAFVRLKGVPAAIRLSDGHSVTPGVWAIPLFALGKLRAIVPADVSGRSELTATLLDIDGGTLAETSFSLVITPSSFAQRSPAVTPPPPPPVPAERPKPVIEQPTAQAPVPPPAAIDDAAATKPAMSAPQPPVPQVATIAPPVLTPPQPAPPAAAVTSPPAPAPAPAPAAPALSIEEQMRLEGWLATGDRAMLQGNVVHARQFYERVAERGLALAAFKMAETYDPVELEKLGVVGLAPDKPMARRWYERAKQLGDIRAENRLRRLDGRP